MGHFYQAKVKRANAEVGDKVTGCQEGTTDGRKKEPQMEERAAQGAGRSEPRWGLSHWAALGQPDACASPPRGTSWQSARLIGPGFPETDLSTLS